MQFAKAALGRLEALNPPEEKCKVHYCRLVLFSGTLADKLQIARLDHHRDKIPETEDATPHKWWFTVSGKKGWQPDQIVVASIAIFAFTVLCMGVAEKFKIFNVGLWSGFANPGFVTFIFFVLVLATPIPLFLVVKGRKWVRWAQSQIEYLEGQCRSEFIAEGITDSIPDSPPTMPDLSPENLKQIFLAMAPDIRAALGLAPIRPARKPQAQLGAKVAAKAKPAPRSKASAKK